MVTRGRRPTQQDVALAAGVSVATVSYVLNGRSGRTTQLPDSTRARVLEAAQALGYQGNTAARVLRRQRTELIAVVYSPPVGPWLDRLTIQCEDVAAEHGYSVIGIPIRRPERTKHSLRVLELGHVDGAIFTNALDPSIDLDPLRRSTRAIVAFDEHSPADGIDVVRTNVRQAVAEATGYLIRSGRRRIGYLSHGISNPSTDDRYQGFRDAMREAGMPVDPSLVHAGAMFREEAFVAVRNLLDRSDPPDALISESDRGAFAGLQAAQWLGVKVPDDFAVIGVGNTSEADFSTPPLTSIGMHQLDFTDVVEALFARIEDPDRPGQELAMPWILNRRRSA